MKRIFLFLLFCTPFIQAQTTPTQMLTSDFQYVPIRLFYNFDTEYDYSFTMLGEFALTDVSNPQSSALSHFNLGINFSGYGLSEDFGDGYSDDLTVMDLGLHITWYVPVNKLMGSYKVNTGFFPYIYAGGLLRSERLTSDTPSDYYDETEYTGDYTAGIGVDYRFTRGFGLSVVYEIDNGPGAGINFSF